MHFEFIFEKNTVLVGWFCSMKFDLYPNGWWLENYTDCHLHRLFRKISAKYHLHNNLECGVIVIENCLIFYFRVYNLHSVTITSCDNIKNCHIMVYWWWLLIIHETVCTYPMRDNHGSPSNKCFRFVKVSAWHNFSTIESESLWDPSIV